MGEDKFFGSGFWFANLAFGVYAGYQYYIGFEAVKGWTMQEFSDSITWYPPVIGSGLYLLAVWTLPYLITEELTLGGRLKDIMLSYNLYQVVINGWWCYAVLQEVFGVLGYPIVGAPLHRDEKGLTLGFLMWVHYNNKFIELLDSAFMILRAKKNQLSFLHMYHHLLIIWAWYIPCKLWNGSDIWFGAWANSFIHVLMYGYYFMAAIKIACPWKKRMTQMQMLQFCICFTQATAAIVVDSVPWHICIIQHWVMANMLVLFGNFYRKQYAAAGKKNEGGADKKSVEGAAEASSATPAASAGELRERKAVA